MTTPPCLLSVLLRLWIQEACKPKIHSWTEDGVFQFIFRSSVSLLPLLCFVIRSSRDAAYTPISPSKDNRNECELQQGAWSANRKDKNDQEQQWKLLWWSGSKNTANNFLHTLETKEIANLDVSPAKCVYSLEASKFTMQHTYQPSCLPC